MALITPVGKSQFDWSPKSTSLNKTASTGSAEPSDKDLLFALAKKVVEAQFEESGSEEVTEVSAESGCDVEDAKAAVDKLVEKAECAEQLCDTVDQAVSKVEEAIQEVRDALSPSGETAEVMEEVTVDISDDKIEEDKSDPMIEEVTLEVEDEDDEVAEIEIVDEDTEEVEVEDEGGEDIIQESKEICAEAKSKISKELKKEAAADEFMKISKVSPTTRKKVMKFWKDDLGYVSDYVKLMVTNYEK
jgi:hypothetical protein